MSYPLPKIPASALGDILAGHALLGRTCAALKDKECASEAYGKVLSSWHGPDSVTQLQSAAGDDQDGRNRLLQRGMLAVGEALFYSAEQHRDAVSSVRMPTYSGPPTREGIERFVLEEVRPWVARKQALVEAVEDEYVKVTMLEPAAPPRWVVDASARIAQTWGRFNAELRAAPIPPEWARKGEIPGRHGVRWDEIRSMYYRVMDRTSVPLQRRARGSFQACRENGRRLGHQDEFSKSCDAWLANAR